MRAFYDRFRVLIIILAAVLAGISIGSIVFMLGRQGALPRTNIGTATFEGILNFSSNKLIATYYASNHNILVLDFPSLWHQAKALNRVAALVEKTGTPRDRILGEDELIGYAAARGTPYNTFYYGHNYTASDMARFYNLAKVQELGLNRSEERLRRLLLDSGFIQLQSEKYRSGVPKMALISIVQASANENQGFSEIEVDRALRETTFLHELSHGEFYTNAQYRNYCIQFWRERMSKGERAAFRKFLAANDYEVANEDTMVNEMQAYLAHTIDPRAFSAALIGLSEQALEDLRQRFWSELELKTGLNTFAR